MPTFESFFPYKQWRCWGYFGNPKRKTWWADCLLMEAEPAIIGVYSLTQKLNAETSSLQAQGVVSSPGITLTGITTGQVGNLVPHRVPMKSFTSYAPIQAPRSALFAISAKEITDTVYRALLPYPTKTDFGPVWVLGSDNRLRPNIHQYPCLYAGLQERLGFQETLMQHLSQGFVNAQLTDPDKALCVLKNNSEILVKENKSLIKEDPNSFNQPIVAYEEIWMNGRMVLKPFIYFPQKYDNPKKRDGSGGFFTDTEIRLTGSGSGARLSTTGHLHTEGLIAIQNFEEVTHQRNIIQETHTVTDKITNKSYMGTKKKTHIQKKVETRTAGPGNTITAAEVVYQNIHRLVLSGVKIQAGVRGLQAQNIGVIEQRVLIEDRLAYQNKKQKNIMGQTLIDSYGVEQHLVSSEITSSGPVLLQSEIGFYDNLVLNQLSILGEHPAIMTKKLIIGETSRKLAALRQEEVEREKQARKKSRNKEIKMLGKAVAVTVATAGTGSYLGGVLTTLSPTLFAAKSFTLAATQGAFMGGMSAALMGNNVSKGVLTGAVFRGFGHQVDRYLSQVKSLEKAAELREKLQVLAESGLSSVIYGGNPLQNAMVALGSHEVASQLVPKTKDASPAVQLGQTTLSAFIQGGVASLLNNENPSRNIMMACSGAMNAIGSGVGSHYGHKMATRYQKSSALKNYSNENNTSSVVRASNRPIYRVESTGIENDPISGSGSGSRYSAVLAKRRQQQIRSRDHAQNSKGQLNYPMSEQALYTPSFNKREGNRSQQAQRSQPYKKQVAHHAANKLSALSVLKSTGDVNLDYPASKPSSGILGSFIGDAYADEMNHKRSYSYHSKLADILSPTKLVADYPAKKPFNFIEASRAIMQKETFCQKPAYTLRTSIPLLTPQFFPLLFFRDAADFSGGILRETGLLKIWDDTWSLVGKMTGAFAGYAIGIPERTCREFYIGHIRQQPYDGSTPLTDEGITWVLNKVSQRLKEDTEGLAVWILQGVKRWNITENELIAYRVALEVAPLAGTRAFTIRKPSPSIVSTWDVNQSSAIYGVVETAESTRLASQLNYLNTELNLVRKSPDVELGRALSKESLAFNLQGHSGLTMSWDAFKNIRSNSRNLNLNVEHSPQLTKSFLENSTHDIVKSAVHSDLHLPSKAVNANLVTKPKFVNLELTDVGRYKPVPLTQSELTAIYEWTKVRKEYLKKWMDMDVSKLPKVTQRILLDSASDKKIMKNMTPDDLAAIFKEARGVKIFDKDGKLTDHFNNEWKQARDAHNKQLDGRQNSIHWRLGKLYEQGYYPSREAELLREKLSDLSKLKDTYSRLIREQECRIKKQCRR